MRIALSIILGIASALALDFDPQTHTFPALDTNNAFTGNNTHSGTETFKQLENVRYADQFAGADIFAQANAAATAEGSPGVVVIPPGTYTAIATTLLCVNNTKFVMNGVTATYSGTTVAIKIQNVTSCDIDGPFLLKGPGSGGTTIGIQLGIGSGGSGTQLTIHNNVKNVKISGFGKAFVGEGSTGGNGTYFNTIENVATEDGSGNGNGIGFYLVPTISQQFNNNTFIGCAGKFNTSDGWVIDGSYNSLFINVDAESNGRYGVNLSANAATAANVWIGGHAENNTTAHFNFGSGGTPANITNTQVLGMFVNTVGTAFVGNINAGTFNVWQPSATPQVVNYPGGSTFLLTVNANAPAASIWQIFNSESPPSGITGLVNLSRSGADAGSITIGSPEYPLTTGNSGSQKSVPSVIANGTLALNTASITTATCDAGKAAAATGTASTDTVDWSFNAAPTATNKYGAFLVVYAVPSANTVTFYTCNPSATTSTPTAMTVNFSVRRP